MKRLAKNDSTGKPLANVIPSNDAVGSPSIDNLIAANLQNIVRATKLVTRALNAGTVDREVIMNLKDIMSMLMSLKKEEQSVLLGLSDDQIKAVLSEQDSK